MRTSFYDFLERNNGYKTHFDAIQPLLADSNELLTKIETLKGKLELFEKHANNHNLVNRKTVKKEVEKIKLDIPKKLEACSDQLINLMKTLKNPIQDNA